MRDSEIILRDQLLSLLHNFKPHLGIPDSWNWKANADGIYYVSSAYFFLIYIGSPEGEEEFKYLWRTPAVSNEIALAWRVLHDRI